MPIWIFRISTLVAFPFLTYNFIDKEWMSLLAGLLCGALVVAGDVEEDDEQDSCPHQFPAITAHVSPFYLTQFHSFGEGIRSMICFTAQERAMTTTT